MSGAPSVSKNGVIGHVIGRPFPSIVVSSAVTKRAKVSSTSTGSATVSRAPARRCGT
jgi:hypothetical protein